MGTSLFGLCSILKSTPIFCNFFLNKQKKRSYRRERDNSRHRQREIKEERQKQRNGDKRSGSGSVRDREIDKDRNGEYNKDDNKDKKERERDREREREREKEKEREREREREREKEKERERDKDKDKEKDKDKDKDDERDKERDKMRVRSRTRSHSETSDKGRPKRRPLSRSESRSRSYYSRSRSRQRRERNGTRDRRDRSKDRNYRRRDNDKNGTLLFFLNLLIFFFGTKKKKWLVGKLFILSLAMSLVNGTWYLVDWDDNEKERRELGVLVGKHNVVCVCIAWMFCVVLRTFAIRSRFCWICVAYRNEKCFHCGDTGHWYFLLLFVRISYIQCFYIYLLVKVFYLKKKPNKLGPAIVLILMAEIAVFIVLKLDIWQSTALSYLFFLYVQVHLVLENIMFFVDHVVWDIVVAAMPIIQQCEEAIVHAVEHKTLFYCLVMLYLLINKKDKRFLIQQHNFSMLNK
ncbi:Protein kinase domain containing protein [Reticulomyxa filosa]|uniref:Protein kinase domain containing protein n=1 Tax=Reticulomyxa filosa TaxID=46433 RepID=X6NJC3_RETFI|nr:Protein kinase domain containing protein [Reticulomyxa filosa]|eukprot:ETO25442.1 Protein kinase domain containing protein [Reticulomyxa filosa]